MFWQVFFSRVINGLFDVFFQKCITVEGLLGEESHIFYIIFQFVAIVLAPNISELAASSYPVILSMAVRILSFINQLLLPFKLLTLALIYRQSENEIDEQNEIEIQCSGFITYVGLRIGMVLSIDPNE